MFAAMKRAMPVALGLLLLAGANGSRIKPAAGAHANLPRAVPADASPFHLDVAITDEDGNVAGPGLTRGNFRLSDNGRDLPITGFAPPSAPATVALLVENSGMAYNYFAYRAADWASDFLNHLAPDDYVALVTYDLRPNVRVDFTRNKAQVRDALRTMPLPPFREANLFDALVETLDRLDRVQGKKAIVLLTTGFNTFSASNFDNVRQRLRETDTTVFVVGTAEAEYMAAESSALSSGGHVGYLQVKNQLGAMARISGGKAWFPRFPGELPDIFEATAAMLRNQYRLGFSPAESSLDGKYHKLKVSVVGPDGNTLKLTDSKGKKRNAVVYAREGYMARRVAPSR